MNYLGFDNEKISDTVKSLNELLSSYHLYYQNLRNFHWNVKGENFFDLHTQFEELYNDARLTIDEIAERILTLRQRPVSRLSDYMAISKVKEAGHVDEDRIMVRTILQDHKILISQMREVLHLATKAGDEGTIDLIGGFLSKLEKKSWMLDAWATRVLVAV